MTDMVIENAADGSDAQAPAHDLVPAEAPAADGSPAARQPAQVKGRIDVEDEVVEKVARLAAIEVDGVADLGGDVSRGIDSIRERIGMGDGGGAQGVKANVDGRVVAIEVTLVIEYGHVVMEVARKVKSNVAVQCNRMLNLRVSEVNVTVDDVQMPAERGGEEHKTKSPTDT